MPIILKNISKSYAEKKVLDNISLEIPDSGIFGVFGASGSGKTTLIRILCGLEKPDEGEISGARAFSVVFQEDRLMPSMTALENVAAVSDEACARRILARLGLEDSLEKYPDELSGGMSRRVAAARAFAFEAEGLILDEPFKGLDEANRRAAMEAVRDFSHDKTVLFVTHDAAEAGFFGGNALSVP